MKIFNNINILRYVERLDVEGGALCPQGLARIGDIITVTPATRRDYTAQHAVIGYTSTDRIVIPRPAWSPSPPAGEYGRIIITPACASPPPAREWSVWADREVWHWGETVPGVAPFWRALSPDEPWAVIPTRWEDDYSDEWAEERALLDDDTDDVAAVDIMTDSVLLCDIPVVGRVTRDCVVVSHAVFLALSGARDVSVRRC